MSRVHNFSLETSGTSELLAYYIFKLYKIWLEIFFGCLEIIALWWFTKALCRGSKIDLSKYTWDEVHSSRVDSMLSTFFHAFHFKVKSLYIELFPQGFLDQITSLSMACTAWFSPSQFLIPLTLVFISEAENELGP